jgi:hypothetical protein
LILRVVTVPPFQEQIEMQRMTPRTRVPDGHPSEAKNEIRRRGRKVGECRKERS